MVLVLADLATGRLRVNEIRTSTGVRIRGCYKSRGSPMQGYRYRFLDTRGHLFADLNLHADSDDSACDLGNELLSRCDCSLLEIRCGVRLIYRIGKAGTPSTDVFH